MTRIRFGRLTVAGLAVALTFAAATHVRADFKSIDAAIHRSARLSLSKEPAAPAKTGNQPRGGAAKPHAVTVGGATFLQLKESLTGHKRKTVGAIKLATGQPSSSTVTQVGSPPAGFGSTFNWDRSQQSVLLVVFVNAADPLGVSITGLQPGDVINVKSASGLASFVQDTGNPLASSLIGLVADGGAAAVSILDPGALGAGQAIQAAGQQAASLFKGTGAGQKVRDAFGLDPSTKGYALAEGGVIVCMPQGGGTYYSAYTDHRNYWATNPSAVGQPRGLPQVYQSQSNDPPFFFIGQAPNSPNAHTCTSDNPAFILAWDFAYLDNAGFYEVFVQLTQGSNSGSGGQGPGGGGFKAPPRRR
jgi:hypothetical protein